MIRLHFDYDQHLSCLLYTSRKRPQVFEGVVIKRQGSGVRETFTVRKQSFGVGVERTFPLHSPKIEKLEVASRGRVRRAKLYYLRGRVGKAARVAERRWGIDEDMVGTSAAVDASGEAQEPIEEVNEAPEAEVTESESTEATEAEATEAPEACLLYTSLTSPGILNRSFRLPLIRTVLVRSFTDLEPLRVR